MLLLPKPVRQPRRNRTESIARAISAPDRYHLERAGEWIEQLYRAWGKPDQAAEWPSTNCRRCSRNSKAPPHFLREEGVFLISSGRHSFGGTKLTLTALPCLHRTARPGLHKLLTGASVFRRTITPRNASGPRVAG
jgi:hypothetical protein